MAQGEDLGVFFAIGHRQQSQHGEGVGDGEVGEADQHETRSCLHDKGEVTRQQVGRGYAYTAIEDSVELAARRMQRVLDAEGPDRPAVLMRFVGALAPDDENLLRSLLDTGDAP